MSPMPAELRTHRYYTHGGYSRLVTYSPELALALAMAIAGGVQ